MVRSSSKSRSLLLLLLLGSVLPLTAGAIRRPQHRLAIQQIQQLENDWRAAQLGPDIPVMDRLLSEDFLGITANGKVVTKTQQLERMRTRQFAVKSLNVEDTKIKLIGGIAIVTSLATIEGDSEGSSVNGSYRYTRIYQRIGGTWKITSFEATRIPQPNGTATARGRDYPPPQN